jgi:hypothetical protein
MKRFTSGLSFVIQAILVVAAVLLFAYIDPFDFFVSNKLKLKDTPAHIREIRSIGELISAEYYGEVISSYQSKLDVERKEEIKKTKSQLEIMDSTFLERLDELASMQDNALRKHTFDSVINSFRKYPNFDDYLSVVKKEFKIKFWNKLYNKLLDQKKIEELYDDKNKVYLKGLKSARESEINEFYSQRSVRKPQLILLGRGKVQAGFRFGKLDARNMMVDTLRKRIILFGIQPEILSCDINPWLIPELGIKGFEIIDLNRKADDPSILNQVKQACLDSLRANAIRSDILNIAKVNAEQNLQTFFSLLLNDPSIEVRIESDLISYYHKTLRSDSLINLSELANITTTISGYLDPPGKKNTSHYDSLRAFDLLDTLKRCRLEAGTFRSPVTPFSAPIHRLLTNRNVAGINRDSVRNSCIFLKTLIQKDWKIYSPWFYLPEERKFVIDPDSLKKYVDLSNVFFDTIFNRIYPDTIRKVPVRATR